MNFPVYSIYNLASGILLDIRLGGGEIHAADVPPGCALIEGELDHLAQRIELRPDDFGNAVVPFVVDYQPPAPSENGLMTWAWNAATKRWDGTPTLAARAAEARAQRDVLMSRYDWVTLRAMRTGQPIPADWAAYLQALADVPAQPGFPAVITWPEPPATP